MVDLTITVRKVPNAPAGQNTYEYTGIAGIVPAFVDAVWDEPRAGHVDFNQFGGYINTVLNGVETGYINNGSDILNFPAANTEYAIFAVLGTVADVAYHGHVKIHFNFGHAYIVHKYQLIDTTLREIDPIVVNTMNQAQNIEWSFGYTESLLVTIECNGIDLIPDVVQWEISIGQRGEL